MKLVFTLLACAIALATAAPALGGNGQSVSESLGTVQAGATNVSPVDSVAAPVGAAAPVCVASRCSSSQSIGSAGSGGATSVKTGTSHAGGQRVSESVGTVQAGSTNVSPVVSAAAPVGVSAPVCALSRCSSSQSVAGAGSGGKTNASGGTSHAAGQQVSKSLGTVQLGSTNLSPVVSAAAPAGVSAPACVLSSCSSKQVVGGAASGGVTSVGGSGKHSSGGGPLTPPPAKGGGGAPGDESPGVSPRGGASSGTTPSHRSGGAKPIAGAQRGVGSSALKVPKSGVFTPTAVPHGGFAVPSFGSGQGNGHHSARHSSGCDFPGASAKLRVKPTAASFAPSGGFSWTLLLAILCGVLGFSSLAQWARSEARWLKG